MKRITSLLVTFSMPKAAKKRLPCLSADELSKVIAACQSPRDKALTLFMAIVD